MHTVYLQNADIDRAQATEYRIKRAKVVRGRVGLSLLTRVGLAMIERELQKDEKKTLEFIVKIAAGEEA